MEKLLIVVTTIAVFLSFTPAAWAEETADTLYEPYEFESTKKEGFVIQDNGVGFCQICLTLTRVETSFIPIKGYYYAESYTSRKGEWTETRENALYIQNPSQIIGWLTSAIGKWQNDNPEKEIIEIDYINTGMYLVPCDFIDGKNGGLAPTTGCIIRYK